MCVWPLDKEDPLEEGMATYSSILSWRILWTERPSELQLLGSQRVRHNCSDWTCIRAEKFQQENKVNKSHLQSPMPWSPSLAPHWLFSHACQLLPSMFSTSCINWTFRFSLSMLHTPLLWSPWTVSFWNSTHLSGYTSKTISWIKSFIIPQIVLIILSLGVAFMVSPCFILFWQCSWITMGNAGHSLPEPPTTSSKFFLLYSLLPLWVLKWDLPWTIDVHTHTHNRGFPNFPHCTRMCRENSASLSVINLIFVISTHLLSGDKNWVYSSLIN